MTNKSSKYTTSSVCEFSDKVIKLDPTSPPRAPFFKKYHTDHFVYGLSWQNIKMSTTSPPKASFQKRTTTTIVYSNVFSFKVNRYVPIASRSIRRMEAYHVAEHTFVWQLDVFTFWSIALLRKYLASLQMLESFNLEALNYLMEGPTFWNTFIHSCYDNLIERTSIYKCLYAYE